MALIEEGRRAIDSVVKDNQHQELYSAFLNRIRPQTSYSIGGAQSVLVIDFCPDAAVNCKHDKVDLFVEAGIRESPVPVPVWTPRVSVSYETFDHWLERLHNHGCDDREKRDEYVTELANWYGAGGMLVVYMMGDWLYSMSRV